MKRRFERIRHKKLNTNAYIFASLLFVSFSLLLFSTQSFIVNIQDAGLSVFSGIRGTLYALSSFVSGTVNSIQELATLREEYKELVDKMTRYEQLERNAAEIRAENNRLREQLDFSRILEYKHIPAEIIGRDPDNLFSALVINKGKAHGISKDMPVIAYQNGMEALVGKVLYVGQLESLVIPLYDSRSYVASRFAQGRYEGITEGQGRSDKPLVVQSVDKKARYHINKGDLVVTSGMGGVYPSGITIGRVSGIFFKEDETSFETELESAISFSKLEYVFVIESKKDFEYSENNEVISEGQD
ncbi:MAG: rod shape-determining protein MreC [Spirochaetaceae bacterium]|jgi:rod shape-determining protein MreC|nr:rod shape-determining protein MreC [Spirochaetaceae bacterium]